jgi:hypothetical protein
MVFLIVFVFIIVALLQIPVLIKKKYWRELIAFSVLYIVAFGLSMLYVLGVQIPSPMPAIKYVIEDILHIKY